jgi:hypothetical protein
VIRLRREIERGLANRWLRILLVVLLVGLLALVLLHGVHDQATEADAAACAALVIILVFLVVPMPAVVGRTAPPLIRLRGPPPSLRVTARSAGFHAQLIPLRR